jgi:hypothetical protein
MNIVNLSSSEVSALKKSIVICYWWLHF